MSQYVVWYDSSETGAPVLNNAAGSLIGVIDACGITGFNPRSITSVVVAAGVATATCAGHGYSGTYGKDVELAGATPAGLNGRKALTYVDTNTFKFDATGIADGAATGAITAKRSPFGLVKQHAGTNRAIYKRSDVTASSMMLRVLDTAAAPATTTDARVFMVETATDADTYTGQGPTVAQIADGQYWNKGSNSATAKQWALIGSSKGFFLVTPNSAVVLPQAGTTNAASLMAFFDFPSFKAGDAYNTALSGPVTSSGGSSVITTLGQSNIFTVGNASLVIARPHSQVGGAVRGNCTGIATGISGDNTSWPVYPSPIDNGLFVFPSILITEDIAASGYPPRGIVPGLCQVLGRVPFVHYQITESVNALPGRKLLALNHGSNGSGGVIALDLDGSWGA